MNAYDAKPYYDEMFAGPATVRDHYQEVGRQLQRMGTEQLHIRQAQMNRRLMEEGITFTLSGSQEADALERTIPFDLLPRIIPRHEWSELEAGLMQRVKALNLFVKDVYSEQHILKDGIVPRRMIVGNRYFRPEMKGVTIPGNAPITAAGIDLIRDEKGSYYVLEDNLRSPSGFSYLFQSRSLMTRLCPELMFSHPVLDVEQGISMFRHALVSLTPSGKSDPLIALLTPGSHNSAYYEHAFLAQQLGIELVEGRDLVFRDHRIYMRGMNGIRQVDVLYRRIDDEYLDPLAFRPDSVLGVAGLMNAYRAGHIAIVNAPGTGVADDKAVYVYVPDMIRYYLNEAPILSNVPTYLMSNPEHREYVLQRLPEMVVKETSLSGGYGMLIGPSAGEEELKQFAEKIRTSPDTYIAQPTIKLSTAPVLTSGQLAPRHIDLRAFVLSGHKQVVLPGGLTRVAMKSGSLVVNSSQGGGCKDTWVLSR